MSRQNKRVGSSNAIDSFLIYCGVFSSTEIGNDVSHYEVGKDR